MGCDGVSDVSAGAGKGVGRMVKWTTLTSGSIARSRAYCGGDLYRQCFGGGWGGFWKVTEGGFGKEVLG